MILWEGPSPHNGEPLVALATEGSTNRKTGPMVQVWILHRDINPVNVIAEGLDEALCGRCPLRGDGMRGRACYVNPVRGPVAVWKSYKAGGHKPEPLQRLTWASIRWGAYGDPAMLPWELVTRVNLRSRGWTGYTHQWRRVYGRAFKGVFMASVESLAQEKRARAEGWGTFRAGRADGSDAADATLCLNKATGATCAECRMCDGRPEAVYVPAHGTGKNFIPAERLRRRAA